MVTIVVAIAVAVAVVMYKDLVISKVMGTLGKVKDLIAFIKDKF